MLFPTLHVCFGNNWGGRSIEQVSSLGRNSFFFSLALPDHLLGSAWAASDGFLFALLGSLAPAFNRVAQSTRFGDGALASHNTPRTMSAAAFVIFHCSSAELQARAGFDGWVMLLRDEFDTEDQAWPQERLRLAGMAKRRMRRLEAAGVELDMLQLVTSCHLLLDPPREDREEERIWCIEFFRGRMYDFVVRSVAALSLPFAPICS